MQRRSNSELVQAWFTAIENADIAGAKKLLTPDFVCTGWATVPLDRDQTMAMYKAIVVAFPDLSFHASEVVEHGENVVTTVRITGTHTKDLVMALPKVHHVAATGNAIQLSDSHPKFTLDAKGKISNLELVTPASGGLDAILAQIGAVNAQQHVTL